MTQTGGTHGPHKDDALKRDTRTEIQANRSTATEEWEDPEPPGEDQPDATWALAGRPGPDGGPNPDDLELRSDLARHLDRATFPANRAHLLQTLAAYNAPDRLTDLVSQLPGRIKFSGLPEVLRRLGLPVESRT